MKNLKKSNALFIVLFVCFSGCQSVQKFKMTTLKGEELHVIDVDSNRIIQDCYFMNAEKENNWRHQYSLNILNEKNEVIPVFYPTNQGEKECQAHLKKVENILKKEPRVRLCVRDKFEKMVRDHPEPELFDFGTLGKHQSPYDALTFDTICNSKKCFIISDTWTTTCPGFKN